MTDRTMLSGLSEYSMYEMDISGSIVLNCAMKEVYKGITLMNDHMSGYFPVLKPGLNAIGGSDNVTNIVISPICRYL